MLKKATGDGWMGNQAIQCGFNLTQILLQKKIVLHCTSVRRASCSHSCLFPLNAQTAMSQSVKDVSKERI